MGKFKIPFEEVDTSMPENHEDREKFFDISGIRGDYPMIFIRTGAEGAYEYEFVGTYTEIDGMNEVNDLIRTSPELLEKNPASSRSVEPFVSTSLLRGFCVPLLSRFSGPK